MRFILFILLAISVNAQPFSLRNPAVLGALQPKVAAVPHYGLLTGILSYWKMDETGGDLSDATGNGNTMVAMPAFTVDTTDPENPITNYVGVIDYGTNGIIYTGIGLHNDSSKFQSASYILPSDDFTLSLWFNTTSTAETERLYDTEDNGIAVAINFPSGISGRLGVYAAGYGSYGTTTIGLNDGQWHNLIVVHDTGSLRIYVDGFLDKDCGFLGTFGRGYDTIGGYAAGNQQGIDGVLDEIGVWGRALDSQNITDLSTATPFGSFTP